MKKLAWIFVGVVGLVFTYISMSEDRELVAMVAGGIGAFSWLLFAFGSLGVTEFDGGVQVVGRYPELAAYGVMMAAPNVYVLLTGPLEAVINRETMQSEVR